MLEKNLMKLIQKKKATALVVGESGKLRRFSDKDGVDETNFFIVLHNEKGYINLGNAPLYHRTVTSPELISVEYVKGVYFAETESEVELCEFQKDSTDYYLSFIALHDRLELTYMCSHMRRPLRLSILDIKDFLLWLRIIVNLLRAHNQTISDNLSDIISQKEEELLDGQKEEK